ncbi:hypothetical protein [Methanothermococcus okinawensis]|uniref:Uncharacterized protein n=1 Tax=Methanothermococcus okinawensis (strain DSM 14208 / JCM 11175 / IH1) TaxID=647113 RepID=F8AKA8_METOI|nr:hypothetical protein [Methanothermococcus okinawensis]AEH06308.1 hypothetical protein Metok_0318 [Methanothermococcus okinawensis IH1]
MPAGGPTNDTIPNTNKIYITSPIIAKVVSVDSTLTVTKDGDGNIIDAYIEAPTNGPNSCSIVSPMIYNKSDCTECNLNKIEWDPMNGFKVHIYSDDANETDTFNLSFIKVVPKTMERINNIICDNTTPEYTSDEPPYKNYNILTVNDNAPENFDVVIVYDSYRREILKINKNALYDEIQMGSGGGTE